MNLQVFTRSRVLVVIHRMDLVDNWIDELTEADPVDASRTSRIGGRRSEARSFDSLFSNFFGCREPVSSQVIGVLPGARNLAAAVNERGPFVVGALVRIL